MQQPKPLVAQKEEHSETVLLPNESENTCDDEGWKQVTSGISRMIIGLWTPGSRALESSWGSLKTVSDQIWQKISAIRLVKLVW